MTQYIERYLIAYDDSLGDYHEQEIEADGPIEAIEKLERRVYVHKLYFITPI